MEYLFLVIVLFACVYELSALITHREGDTISEIVWRISSQRPILPFAIGVLCGHFFWQKVGN